MKRRILSARMTLKKRYGFPVAASGTMKMRMGATPFLMKALRKVATGMASCVLTYNLTRVLNIVGVPALLERLRDRCGHPSRRQRWHEAAQDRPRGSWQRGNGLLQQGAFEGVGSCRHAIGTIPSHRRCRSVMKSRAENANAKNLGRASQARRRSPRARLLPARHLPT